MRTDGHRVKNQRHDSARRGSIPAHPQYVKFAAAASQVTGSPWVKYLQLHFLTHYGTEPVGAAQQPLYRYVCALSTSTMQASNSGVFMIPSW